MLLLKHILVATDFSPTSTAALRHAFGIARRCQSVVSLVHVVDAPFYGMTPDGIAAAVECAERDSEFMMKQLRGQGVFNGSSPELKITVGPVWQTISRIVNEQHPGLLVLGTHGRSGIPKLVLGSVAERAFREAPCPVLTVGPRARSSKLSGAEAKHFLVPTDLSSASTNAVRCGLSLARATGGDMTLLHVLNLPSPRAGENAPSATVVKNQIAEFLNEHPGAATMVRPRVEFGNPAPTIVAVAEQMDSDMIVMGLRAWSTDGAPMWRTAYEVVTHAGCPVLSMRSPALSAREPSHAA